MIIIQVNMFDCGGITIDVFVLHMVADGFVISTFLKDWDAIARGCHDGAVSPEHSLPSK